MELNQIKLTQLVKKPILALGSHTKNTVAFAKGLLAYVSSVHADLSNPGDYTQFDKTVKYFLKQNPVIVVYDLHPGYQSTKYIDELGRRIPKLKFVGVQHHHAHIASSMVENGLKNQKVIGVAFDGTGLGSDDTLWGAEFLICDFKSFTRKAHLKEIPLLGGDKAILEPWRLSCVWLYLVYNNAFLKLNIPFIKHLDKKKWLVLKQMYELKLQAPYVSSMGRLFDAASSIILNKHKARFEAELAIELEKLATGYRLNVVGSNPKEIGYKFRINKHKGTYSINPLLVFKTIIQELRTNKAREEIAYKFHLTVAQMIKKTCVILRKETRINKIVLSGGVFQNNLLLGLALDLLYKEGFQVIRHNKVSCNDSGISLGQAVIANARIKSR